MNAEKKLEAIENEYAEVRRIFEEWREQMGDQRVEHSDHDILVRLETVIIGTNGGGLLARFEKMERDFSEFKLDFKNSLSQLWTKKDHDNYCEELEKTVSGKGLSVRGWIQVIAGIGVFVTAIIAIIIGISK